MKTLKRCRKTGLVALCVLIAATVFSQTIAPEFFGQNAWMPDTIGNAVYNGKLHQHWGNVKNSGTVLVRFGGASVDKNMPSNYQYIKMIDSIRANGMEPVIQVPFNNYQFTSQQAASIVQYINITKGKNIIYWTIGNEPDLAYSFTSASQVAAYIKSFASAMKAVDPSIKIIGPDCAWFNQNILDGLTNAGGTNDITGKDANGKYYLDVISYHYYPFNGSQTRAQVISKLTQSGSYQDNLAYLKSRVNSCNAYHNRTGNSILKMALTEGNISWQNASGDGLNGVGANSFISGQFIAEMLGIGMKKGLDFFNMWSVVEGSSSGITNIGYIDPSTGNKKPSYYHFQLLAQNFSGNFVNCTTNINHVKSFACKNSQEICVLLMNQDLTNNYNYTVRLNTGTVSGNNALKINADAAVAAEFSDVISNQSTVLLTFNLSGTILRKCEYSFSGHAMANLPPACIDILSLDTTPPLAISFNPADNSVNVSKNANLAITFSESVQKGNGNILIKENGIVMQTIDVADSNVTVSGNSASINSSDFTFSSLVNIEIAAGVFKDTANNNYTGIADAAIWNFSIEMPMDTTPPVVISFNPADNSVNVSKNANLAITFSEPVQKGSGNILIKENGIVKQTIDVADSNVTVSGNSAIINPGNFSNNARVNVEMPAGVFRDTADNYFAGIADTATWNFAVKKGGPVVVAHKPEMAAKSVVKNPKLVLKFNEKIQKGSGKIIITENGIAKQILDVSDEAVKIKENKIIIKTLEFTEGASVNIEIPEGVIKNLSNENFDGINEWNFAVSAFAKDETSENENTGITEDANIGKIEDISDLPDRNNEEIRIFPNPSKGKIGISFNGFYGEKRIEIFNLAGQTVFVRNALFLSGTEEIDLKNLPNGIYLVKVMDGTQVFSKKFILEK